MAETANATDKTDQIIQSRMKLRERFLKRIEGTPSVADEAPMGTGNQNRHGMPELPPDQTWTAPGKWPVLDLGIVPEVTADAWTLDVDGACNQPFQIDWAGFNALEQVDDISDFHCVTGWSKKDVTWRGVRFSTLAALAEVADNATHVMCHGYDNYTTNIPLEEAIKDDVLLVHTADGGPLPKEHGGPVRMITPQLWAWKGAKWIKRIEFMTHDQRGFWEERGYSNTAYPWRNDRYS